MQEVEALSTFSGFVYGQLLKEYWDGKEPSKGPNPDEVVASGAVRMGGRGDSCIYFLMSDANAFEKLVMSV